ncbi:Rz1-like lysis system protein LysC [Zavarzinella formosa]
MRARTILPLLALSLTPACSSTISRALWPIPPANLTEPCPPLEPLASPATLGDLLQDGIQTSGMYAECAARQKALADWTKL